MKKYIFLFLSIILVTSCTKPYKARKNVTITIKTITVNNAEIRALEIINDSSIVFTGSNGTIGLVTNNKINSIKKIKTDSIIPNFRALAFNQNAFYTLSISNPALLYQYKNNQFKLVYKENHPKVFYDAIAFFDNLNGIAMGDPTDNCLSVLITRDGGNTWSKIPCDKLPKINDGEAAFAASNTNIAVAGSNAWLVTGGKSARVFHTTDKGTTWKVYNTPIIQGKSTTGIYSCDFYNEKIGIIAGGDYLNKNTNATNKAITRDGGKTWIKVAENKIPNYVSCVQYVPKTQGKEVFAVSTNSIFYSSNFGNNWKKIANDSFYAIRIVNKNTAWLSGKNKIAKMIIKKQ